MTSLDAHATRHPRPEPVGVRTVMIAADGSPLSETAYHPAAWIAAQLGATLELVSVVPDGDLVERAATIAGAMAGRPLTKRRVVVGDDPVDELTSAIGNGDAVLGCLATRARSRTAPLLGSTAAALLDRIWSPLLLIGPRAEAARHDGPVVVAVDGGAGDDDLVGVASAWAHALARPLVLVTVAEPVPAGSDGHPHRARGPQDPQAYLGSLADRVEQDGRPRTDVGYDPVSVQDGLAPLLERLAPCLVVAGHRYHGALHRAVVGDHTAAVVRIAPAPVLAVAIGLHR